jgi:hypothetical protein
MQPERNAAITSSDVLARFAKQEKPNVLGLERLFVTNVLSHANGFQ